MAEVGGHTANPKGKRRSFDEFLEELLAADAGFAAEYERLGPQYDAISKRIKARRVSTGRTADA